MGCEKLGCDELIGGAVGCEKLDIMSSWGFRQAKACQELGM